jgi:hypothetical protein
MIETFKIINEISDKEVTERFLKWVGQIKPEDIVKKYKKETADIIWGNTALRTGWLTYGMIFRKI